MIEQIHEGLGANAVETPFADSPFVVMKFGGRSVATMQNWQNIAELLRARLAEGLIPVVVHSALAGVSNALESLLVNAVHGNVEDEITSIEQRHLDLASSLGITDDVFGAEFQKPSATYRWCSFGRRG